MSSLLLLPGLKTIVAVSVTTAVVLLAGLVVLFRGRTRVIDARRALATTLVGVGVTGLSMVLCVVVMRRFFLAVNVAYCALMIAAPICGLALLLATRARTVTRGARAFAWASLLLVPIALHATFVAPWQLTTEHAELALAPERAGRAPITIAILADLQTVAITEHEREAVRRAMAARPDLILLPGDFVQVGTHRIPEILDDFRALVAPLDAPLGVYCVQGNCETKEEVRTLMAGSRVRFLDNEVVEVRHGDRELRICGVDLTFDSPRARAALEAIETAPGSADVRLVVAHVPDVVYALQPDTRVDLVVAGHTHGGQVQLPLLGPPIVLSRVPRSVGAGGLSDLDGRRIYVSRGIGWEHGHAPRVRFLCPPEVSLLRLAAVPSGPGGGGLGEVEAGR